MNKLELILPLVTKVIESKQQLNIFLEDKTDVEQHDWSKINYQVLQVKNGIVN